MDITLEVTGPNKEVRGTVTMTDGKIRAEPRSLEEIVLNKYRVRNISDETAMRMLAEEGWSNGYVTVKKKGS